MNKGKLISSSIAVLFCAGILTACGNNQASNSTTATSNKPAAQSQQHMSWMVNTELETMDPAKATEGNAFMQMSNTMEGLFYLGKNAKPQPALATSTHVSKDQLTWTFTIRKNAKWSNGDPVTAQDFVYGWQRTVDPKTASEYSYLFSGIKNADAIVAGKKKASTLGIKAIGKDKLIVKLEKKVPYFKLLLTFPTFYPQNQKVINKYGSKYGTASKYVVYNGPYEQKGWTGSNLSWKLVKNPDYWDKKHVKLNTINFSTQKSTTTSYNLFQTGKLDAVMLNAQAASQQKNKAGYIVREPATTDYLQFNMHNKTYQNKYLRYAVSEAINRKALAKTLGDAYKPATTLTPQKMTYVNGKDFANMSKDSTTEKVNTYNVKQAKKDFKKAQQQLEKKKISFTILSIDDDTSKKVAEFVQSQLETNLPGLSVSVQSIPSKAQLNKLNSKSFTCSLNGWSADFADPISFLDLETKKNAYNYGDWYNKQYDQLIAASKNTTSTATRMKDLAKAENVLIKDQGITPLVQPGQAWLINPKVKGVIYNSAGIDYNFKYAYIAK